VRLKLLYLQFQDYGYFGFIVYLWYIVIGLLFLFHILFILSSKKAENEAQRRVLIGYSFFCLLFGSTRIFFIISVIYGGSFNVSDNFFLILGYLTGILAIISVIFILETYLLKTKKIITLITLILFILILISLFGVLTKDFALYLIYILSPAAITATIFSYLYLTVKSTGPHRKRQ